MPLSETKKASNNRYLAKFKEIKQRVTPEELETIQQAAAEAGESVQSYILGAVRDRIAGAGAGARTPAGLTEGQRDAAEAAAEAAGVPVEEWLTRAISGQVQRDQSERALRAALTGRR